LHGACEISPAAGYRGVADFTLLAPNQKLSNVWNELDLRTTTKGTAALCNRLGAIATNRFRLRRIWQAGGLRNQK